MALSGMLAEVTQLRVKSLLKERNPAILDGVPGQVALFEETVRSAAVEVVLLTGSDDLPAGPLRALAVEAIACETGSLIEYATYPEQQGPGLNGRGYFLHQRFLELLRRLREETLSGGTGGTGGLSPAGCFPPAPTYPDPAERWPC